MFFFVGTEAELIKLFPIMIACKDRGMRYHLIASGQNDIKDSVIIRESGCG